MPTLKRGRWYAILRNGGKTKWFTPSYETRDEAELREAQERYEVRRARPVSPNMPGSVGALCLDWLATKANTVEASTYRSYDTRIKLWLLPAFDALPIPELRALHVHRLVTVLQSQKPSLHLTTQSHILRVLKMALTYGVRRGWLPRNPMAGERFTRTTPVKAARALTEVQVQQVLAAVAGTWVEGPTRLALYTGMRRGEVCALRWQDVDLRHRVIQVRASVDRLELKGPKGGRERAVPVDRKTAEWLRRLSQRSPSDWVFPAEDGTQLYPDSLTNAFSRITKRHFHDLRHTHASWLLRDGVSLVEVSHRLGHADVSITARVYAHYLPGQGHDTAERFAAMVSEGLAEAQSSPIVQALKAVD